MNQRTLTVLTLKMQLLATLLAVVASVALPQVFHFIGAVSGSGTVPGVVFLPMHLPVILVGLFAGTLAGDLTGLLAPIVSFLLTGMPGPVMMVLMSAELAGYGIFAGLLSSVKMPVFVKVVITQIAGRLVYAVAILIASYGFGQTQFTVGSIIPALAQGLPGLMLQWVFIPLTVFRITESKKNK